MHNLVQEILLAQYPDEDSDPARGGAWGNFTKGSKTKAFAIKVMTFLEQLHQREQDKGQ